MSTPVLWHITFSSYNEKARWALDYKRIRYRLREAPPGLHPLWAWRLGGGRTFPLLQLDGEPIGDRSLLAEKGVLEWVEDVYARHRGARLRP